jgi:hypothetical protein
MVQLPGCPSWVAFLLEQIESRPDVVPSKLRNFLVLWYEFTGKNLGHWQVILHRSKMVKNLAYQSLVLEILKHG